MNATYLINPTELKQIQIGKSLFDIQLKKEYTTNSGRPTWSCRLTSGKTKYDNCALKVCQVTDVIGSTLDELTDDTQEVWVLIARTNSGAL
jgi:hypothetical protein